MSRALLVVAFLTLLAGPYAARPAPPKVAPKTAPKAAPKAPPAPATLAARVDAVVGGEGDKWGVRVFSLDANRVVYDHNGDALLQPASNEKVFTTAAALDALGPQWTTRTSAFVTAKPGRDGVVEGDLLLYGRGDPNLSGRFSPTNDALEPFRHLAAQLRESGVTRVTGALIADDSYLDGPPHGAGWGWADLQWHFGAEVSALSFNDNMAEIQVTPGPTVGAPCVVTVTPDVGYVEIVNETATLAGGGGRISVRRSIDSSRVEISGGLTARGRGWGGEVAVHDPAAYAAAAFRRALADAGITVDGPTRRLDAYSRRPPDLELEKLTELAGLDSLTLGEMIAVVNKHSQNLHAELVLRLLGREKGPSDLASDEAGVAVVKSFLDRIGALAPGAALYDGSGLSRLDRVTSGMLEGTVAAMDRHPHGSFFFGSLPVAGVDGTLRSRLGGLTVHAKTGSLATAKSLSGYATTKRGERLAFSILYNDPNGSAAGIAKIDRVASALAADAP